MQSLPPFKHGWVRGGGREDLHQLGHQQQVVGLHAGSVELHDVAVPADIPAGPQRLEIVSLAAASAALAETGLYTER